MRKAKNIFLVFLAVTMITASMPLCACAYTASDYNVNGDTDSAGKVKVDIKDYVRAKKLAVGGSSVYTEEFFCSLRKIILGIEKLPEQGGSIYLPEVP